VLERAAQAAAQELRHQREDDPVGCAMLERPLDAPRGAEHDERDASARLADGGDARARQGEVEQDERGWAARIARAISRASATSRRLQRASAQARRIFRRSGVSAPANRMLRLARDRRGVIGEGS
jgi:hypothetical protein